MWQHGCEGDHGLQDVRADHDEGVVMEPGPGHDLGGPEFPKETPQPYEDGECRHERRLDVRGTLTCQDCGYIYDETTLTWVPKED
jgi:hypothetical protein